MSGRMTGLGRASGREGIGETTKKPPIRREGVCIRAVVQVKGG